MSMPPAVPPPLLKDVATDPGVFPQRIDFLHQAMLFVRLSQQQFHDASFLDDRILTPQTEHAWVQFDGVQAMLASAAPTTPLHLILHAGHVGSTLLSRLVEEAGGVLGLREPLTLRALAEANDQLNEPQSLVSPAQFETLVRMQLVLWRRAFADTRAVIVKATSTAARVAPRLLDADASIKGVYLNLALEPYLATLLAGENSVIDLRGHGPERVHRLTTLAGAPPPAPLYALSPGELAALAWTTERLTQAQLTSAYGERILSLDFEALLGDVGGALRRVCTHFSLSVLDSFSAGIGQSPVLQRYAKAPEAPYSSELRAQVLQQARQLHAEEIVKGQRWVEAMARQSPPVAALLSAH